MRRVLYGLSNALGLIGGVALVLMMLHVNLDVFGRYVFNSPVPGTLEIVSNYYMVAVVFLPLALVERQNAHISVELLSQHLPRIPRIVLIGFASLAAAVYFAAFTWQTWLDAVAKYQIGEYIRGQIVIINWPSRFLLPVGCALITVLLVWKAWRLFRGDETVLEKPREVVGTELEGTE